VISGLLTSLKLIEVQLDELWAFVKKRKVLAAPKTSNASMDERGSGRRCRHAPFYYVLDWLAGIG